MSPFHTHLDANFITISLTTSVIVFNITTFVCVDFWDTSITIVLSTIIFMIIHFGVPSFFSTSWNPSTRRNFSFSFVSSRRIYLIASIFGPTHLEIFSKHPSSCHFKRQNSRILRHDDVFYSFKSTVSWCFSNASQETLQGLNNEDRTKLWTAFPVNASQTECLNPYPFRSR